MQFYFEKVMAAEKNIFGDINFSNSNIRTLSVKSGDLNHLSKRQLHDALASDVYVVFGASYIKGWLIDYLIARDALNIHMGLSPYYRGSSCNFWALFDGNPGHVGATIHMLSKGLDSGDMLFHCLPYYVDGESPFDFTMRSVEVAHKGLVDGIKNGTIFSTHRNKQESLDEIRYTRNADFTDAVAGEFLEREYKFTKDEIEYPKLYNPFFS